MSIRLYIAASSRIYTASMVRLTLTSPFPEGTGSRRGGVPFGGVISLHASNIAHATPSSDFIERWVVKLAYCTFRKKGLMASNALIVPPEARPNHHHQQQPTHCPVPDCVQHGNPYHAREQILHQRYRKGIASAFAFPSPEAIDCCNGEGPGRSVWQGCGSWIWHRHRPGQML